MPAHGRRGHTVDAQSAGAGRQRRARIRSLRSAIARIAVGGALVMGAFAAVPAAAGACPSWANINGFQGHSTTDFTGTASGSDNAGGTVSVELSRSGIAAIKLIARIPRSVSGPVEFLGKTTASVVDVTATSIDLGDTYFDSLPNGTITARQDASGASLAKTPEDLACERDHATRSSPPAAGRPARRRAPPRSAGRSRPPSSRPPRSTTSTRRVERPAAELHVQPRPKPRPPPWPQASRRDVRSQGPDATHATPGQRRAPQAHGGAPAAPAPASASSRPRPTADETPVHAPHRAPRARRPKHPRQPQGSPQPLTQRSPDRRPALPPAATWRPHRPTPPHGSPAPPRPTRAPECPRRPAASRAPPTIAPAPVRTADCPTSTPRSGAERAETGSSRAAQTTGGA